MRLSGKVYDVWLLVLRLTAGGFMLTHGFPKLETLLLTEEIKFPDPIGIGEMPSLVLTVFAEFLCAVLVIIGLKTRLASFFIVITMLVAAIVVHGNDPFSNMEKAFLYTLIFGTLTAFGAGKFSIDAGLRARSRRL